MIVILEDDKSIRDLVLYTLKASQIDAIGYANSQDFYDSLKESIPQLLLLDIMLPQEDGLQVLKKLRNKEETKYLPIIMLTAKDTEYDKIIGLDSGADDYITKPFSMLELVSRIKALLRRVEKTKNKILNYNNISLDDDRHIVLLNNEIIDLTLKEYDILKLLLLKQGQVVRREDILNNVWGQYYIGETRTLDVHIRTLRTKLGECEKYIKTIRGLGYVIGGHDD